MFRAQQNAFDDAVGELVHISWRMVLVFGKLLTRIYV